MDIELNEITEENASAETPTTDAAEEIIKDENDTEMIPAPAAEKTLVQKIVERFQATLAAILSIFKKLFRLFKR